MNQLRLSFSLSLLTIAAAWAPIGCSSGPGSTAPDSRSQQSALHACTSGATRIADDGCNECECVSGEWQCTELACEVPSARPQPPVSPPAPTPLPLPQPVCVDGDTEDAADGCNTCTCTRGTWACTELYCAPPPPPYVPPTPKPKPTPPVVVVCKDGDEAPADDGCNWCWCGQNDWHCTQLGCDG